jgi:hypothetical protein
MTSTPFDTMAFLRCVRAPHALGAAPRSILFALGTFADGDGSSCYPSDPQLAAAAGVTERTVRKWRPVLEWVGLVELKRHQLGYNYRLRVLPYLLEWDRNHMPLRPERRSSQERNEVPVTPKADRNEVPVRPEPYATQTGTTFHQPTQEPTQEPTHQEQEGVPTVVPRASDAAARSDESAPPPLVQGWGVSQVGEDARRLAIGLVGYMEREHCETGHRSSVLAPLLARLLEQNRWDVEAIKAEVKRALPGIRARFGRRPERAVGALLEDMAAPDYGTKPGRAPKKLANTLEVNTNVLDFLEEVCNEVEARDAARFGVQGVA